jgi:hypothetical protein
VQFAEEFLKNVHSFPKELNGTPWGNRAITIDFLSGPYVFNGLNRKQSQVISERFFELTSTDSPALSSPAIHTHIYKLPEKIFRSIDTSGWEYRMDFDYQEKYIRIAGMRFMAYIQLEPALEAWMWTADDSRLISNSAFENIFRVIVAYKLLSEGGMVLHSAGLAQDNNAWLFIGRSGAGKSTISKLGEDSGMTILSDDMNAVILKDGAYHTEQLPFAGEHGQTAVTKGIFSVQGVYYLQKSAHNEIIKTTSAKRLAELLVCSPFINTDPYRYAALATNLALLRDNIKGGNLNFSLAGGFQPLLSG